MRAKMIVGGICFFLIMGLIAYASIPYVSLKEVLGQAGEPVPLVVWNLSLPLQRNNTAREDYTLKQICRAENGDYLLLGNAGYFTLKNKYDLYLSRIDPAGNVVWEERFESGAWDHPAFITPHPSGGYQIVGNSDGVKLLRIDEEGEKTWERFIPMADGEYTPFATGFIRSLTHEGGMLGVDIESLFKLDRDGNLLWEVPIQPDPFMEASDGGFFALWPRELSDWEHTYVGRYGADMTEVWKSPPGFAEWLAPTILMETSGLGLLVVSRYVEDPDALYFLRFGSQGNMVSDFVYNQTGNRLNTGASIKLENGGSIITAWGISPAVVVFKFNPKGEMEWAKDIPVDNRTFLDHGIETRDGGYLLVGSSIEGQDRQGYIVRLDKWGNEIWTHRGRWIPNRVYEAEKGEYIITGESLDAPGGTQAVVFKIVESATAQVPEFAVGALPMAVLVILLCIGSGLLLRPASFFRI